MDKRTRLQVMRLPGRSTLIIRQTGEPTVFVSSHNVILIDENNLVFLIKFLLDNGLINREIIERILKE